MSKTSSFVEVNGNRYDAITGELISKVKKASAAISNSSGRKLVDGFVNSSYQKPTDPKKNTSKTPHPKVTSAGLHTGHEKSRTLMRRMVKKPTSVKTTEPQQSHARSNATNPVMESRAKTATKHSSVSRFGFFSNSQQASQETPTPVLIKPSLKIKRVMQSDAPLPRTPSMITSVSHQKLEKMLDQALVKASAHKQMMNGTKRLRISKVSQLPRRLGISLAIFVAVIITAFLVWQNLPSVAVHVAAARAHVKASVPGYTPKGYSFVNPIKYGNGSLSLHYINKTHSSDGFLLTQKSSNWDSATLSANAIPKDVAVQTSEVNGTTVYVYGHANDAAWVNHGVLYNLQNKSNLSSDQVMKIVSSM